MARARIASAGPLGSPFARSARWLGLLAALCVGACAADPNDPFSNTDKDVIAAIDRGATPMGFTVCHGYGCWKRSAVDLTPAEWRDILALFATTAADPAAERMQVSQAIALFERAVGPRTGTSDDSPRAPLNFADLGQLDCVDEAINTSTYLNMLHEAALLRWHTPALPARRGHFLTLNIHFTATLRETASGAYYVVDSWFFANGVPPPTVPLTVWRAGWQPS